MKKTILLICLGIFSLSFQEKKEKKKKQKVYICNSVRSTRYHYDKDCRGLSKCKSNIKITTRVKAKKYGRISCEIEKTIEEKK